MLRNRLAWTISKSIRKCGFDLAFQRSLQTSHGDKWINLRNKGFPINSTLQHIDPDGPNVNEGQRSDETFAMVNSISADLQSNLTARISVAFRWDEGTNQLRRHRHAIPNGISKGAAVHLPGNNLPIQDSPAIISIRDFIIDCAKSKKGKGKGSKQVDSDKEDEDDDDDDDDDEDDDDPVGIDYRDLDIETGSLRLDAVMRTAFPMARKKVEEAHADDRIRVNGERFPKRSIEVAEDDIIDYVLGRNRANSQLIDVRRVKILEVPEYKTAKDRVKFKVRRWTTLTIENFPVHPFESQLLREEEEDPRKR